MGRNRDYRGGRNPSGIPGGVKSFKPRQRGGPDRGPPKPRSSSDRRSPSPPRPHRRLRLPGCKWFGFFPPFYSEYAPPPDFGCTGAAAVRHITTCPSRFSELAPSLCIIRICFLEKKLNPFLIIYQCCTLL